MAEQFAKEISSEKDYYITARYSNQLLKKTKAKGIIYPSIRYLYKGFNYAFSPCLFKDNSLQLEEISEYKVFFDKNDITKYPTIIRQNSTSYFDDDNILSIVKAGDALPEDGVQPGGEGPRPILGRGGIAVCSKGGQLLDNPELLDVSGNGGLGTVKSFILERFQKLFLGLDITGRYNLHDLGLSLGLHMHCSFTDS